MATTGLAERWIKTVDPDNGHYPLGLAMLHAVAEQAGHSVETLYLVRESREDSIATVLAAVERTRAQVLGLSMITDNRVSSFLTIEAAQARFPDLRIILGGIHVTTMHEQILTRYPGTVAVLGEGELTLPDLLDAFETGRDLATVAGIAYVRDGTVVKTACRPLVDDLDTLPLPRHDLFYSPRRITGQLLTSRGCPFKCSFCVLDATSQRKVRTRSPEKVVDEIELILATQPQTQFIHIYDDQFFADNRRVIAICDEIVRRGIKTRFVCQGRVKPICRELVLALERAGFTTVTLGLETGSPSVLEKCHKKITPEDVENAVRLFADSPIEVTVLLIIGLPGETLQTVMETIDLCRKLQKIKYHVYDSRIQDLYIYPGTEIYEMAKAAGQLDDEFWLTDADCPKFRVELREPEFIVFREIMLTNLSAERLFTPGGFAAQRGLIHHIIKYTLTSGIEFQGRNSIRNLLWAAVEHMMLGKRMAVVAEGALPESVLVIRRKPGTHHDVVMHSEPFAKLDLAELVRLAYQENWAPLTDAVDWAVTTFLEEAFATGDGRLGPLDPLPPEEAAQRLRF